MKTLFTALLLSLFSFSIFSQINPDSGLVAYFPFNGNANDETGNGYDGTINGNATLVPDRFNSSDKAFTFPDQSSSISLANSTSLNLENGFTINAWIKYTLNNYTTVIVCKHVCGFVNGFFFGIDSDGQIQLWLGQSGWSTVRTNQSFVEGQWYMVTASYDATTSTAKVYVNGELGGSGNVVYNNFSSNPISIGEVYLNNCGAGFMDGAVDEVKIYNRALSDAEILEEYNNTYIDLVLFLPFNSNANDESGNGNNGTINGATLTQDRFGVPAKAYYFNGTGDFISIPDNPNLFSDELTISWWYKLTEIPGPAAVVIGWVDGGHRYQQFFSGGQLSYLNGYNVGQPGVYFNPIYGLNDLNVWKNVVVTYKKLSQTTSTTSIYVDGELKQTDNHNLAMDYTPGPDFFIGKNHNGNFFKGYLDDFRIYNRVLNDNEILALFTDSSTYFPDSLIAYFPFNGNANDESVFHNNGSAVNALLTTDRFANQDAAYYFNGSDSRIQVPENSLYDFGFGDFTMSAWVNVSVFGTSRIVSAGYDENDNIWGLGFGTHPVWGNGIRINYFLYSGNEFRDFSSDEIFNYLPGEWTFVTVSKSADQIKFYKDGKLAGTQTINYPSNSNSLMSIGCRQYSSGNFQEFFNGKIDEVKIFNKSFSNQEIFQMYKSTTSAPNLQSPANNAIVNTLTPLLVWDSLVTATNYSVMIATDSLFNTIVLLQFSNAASYLVESGALNPNVDYYWKVRTNNDGGVSPWSDVYHFTINLTDVEDEQQLPTGFALLQNYPNPFNPTTIIKYQLPVNSNVTLKVYDVLGKEVATLVNGYKSAGRYEVEFNTTSLSSGVYFYQLKTGSFVETKKMIILK
ncbi:5'-Nucleotidase domain protein [Ignavibacterium album JCM 16511]|uniref:5'-Nucleotidase domain protein n=1 Tax=Ignavibacterium album (strain DSM 19864 / JCM 16511 / NBRC 101810 / Mat9-16) TaxID=945713 RepID=I0AFZ3_IGNAJ|nr:LamG-like jellyroll fold domain-containing protein [Ignavibacterium album]AFH47900.1 5'-Nucleotidase domain protein [Ignavibacterium album JCM 16511]